MAPTYIHFADLYQFHCVFPCFVDISHWEDEVYNSINYLWRGLFSLPKHFDLARCRYWIFGVVYTPRFLQPLCWSHMSTTMATNCWSTFKSNLWGHAAVIEKGDNLYTVAAEHPQSTIKGTPACSGHSCTSIALNESLVAGQEEPGSVHFANQSGAPESQSHSRPQHVHCD